MTRPTTLPGLVDAGGRPLRLDVDQVAQNFWRRDLRSYEEVTARLVEVAARLRAAGCDEWSDVAHQAAVLLAEVYVARREGAVRR